MYCCLRIDKCYIFLLCTAADCNSSQRTLNCPAAKATMLSQRNEELTKMLGLDLPKAEKDRFEKWCHIDVVRKKVEWLQGIENELKTDHGSVCWLYGYKEGKKRAPGDFPRPRTVPGGSMYPITESQISCMQVCSSLHSSSYSPIVLMIRCLYIWLDFRLSWVHHCGMVSGKIRKPKTKD